MSRENVEVVRSFYDAWARNEFPGPVELRDPEIEYVNPAGAVEPGTRRGLAGFKRAVDKVFEGWETWDVEAERFRAAEPDHLIGRRGDCGRRLPPLALQAPRRTLPTAAPQPVTWRGPGPSPSWP
jgi:hypothetical protein